MKVIFQMFDEIAYQFQTKQNVVTLGGIVIRMFIIPVILYMKCNHKNCQVNICCSESIGRSVCVTCNNGIVID